MSKSDSFFNSDQYATVAERIELFYSRFPEGRINTELISRDNGEITFKALVYRTASESLAAATGWASEKEGDGDVNTVACLENTETSAIGRALANLGFTATSQRPSREEMLKANRERALRVSEASHRLTTPGRSTSVALQRNAARVTDALDLLAVAQRAGLTPCRARRLRETLMRPASSEG